MHHLAFILYSYCILNILEKQEVKMFFLIWTVLISSMKTMIYLFMAVFFHEDETKLNKKQPLKKWYKLLQLQDTINWLLHALPTKNTLVVFLFFFLHFDIQW